jgi:hypothetical protein
MFRRFLIRLRFMPVIGRLFDHLPAALRIAWSGETATTAPEPVWVPPRDARDREDD